MKNYVNDSIIRKNLKVAALAKINKERFAISKTKTAQPKQQPLLEPKVVPDPQVLIL